VNKLLQSVKPYILTLVIILLAWKGLSSILSKVIFPAPEDVIGAFGLALFTKTFWLHFLASAYRALMAMVIAWLVGFPLGILMGHFKKVDQTLSPFVYLTYPVPKVVLLPIVLLLFGLGDLSKILIISLILGYQVLVTTRDGVKSIPKEYLKSIYSLGASNWQVMKEGLIPAALPYGFTALRLNSGVSVAVLFFVESFATETGLGFLIMDAWGMMAFDDMFIGIFGMSLLGVSINEMVNLLEKRFCPWFNNFS
jgi:NitT/TauT family transport system permease protein